MLIWICSFFLGVLVIISLMIIKRNKNKIVPIIMLFFLLAILTKLLYFRKYVKVLESYYLIDFTKFEYTMYSQLPILFFMMASILNCNFWITFYQKVDYNICQFKGLSYDKKQFRNKKLCLNIITTIIIIVLLTYTLCLATFLYKSD